MNIESSKGREVHIATEVDPLKARCGASDDFRLDTHYKRRHWFSTDKPATCKSCIALYAEDQRREKEQK